MSDIGNQIEAGGDGPPWNATNIAASSNVADYVQVIADQAAELEMISKYIRAHHNGYDANAREVFPTEPESIFAAIRDLVEEREGIESEELKLVKAENKRLRAAIEEMAMFKFYIEPFPKGQWKWIKGFDTRWSKPYPNAADAALAGYDALKK